MSKYTPLWAWIRENGSPSFQLSFAEIETICGAPLVHSFLRYKKELADYGYQVGRISMKAQTVAFRRVE